jgi:hypothetical protein
MKRLWAYVVVALLAGLALAIYAWAAPSISCHFGDNEISCQFKVQGPDTCEIRYNGAQRWQKSWTWTVPSGWHSNGYDATGVPEGGATCSITCSKGGGASKSGTVR